jgi:predicted Zn-dependent protease
MSVQAWSFSPLRAIVALVTVCCIVTVISSASGIASMTVQEEKQMGDKLAREIQQNLDMVNDPLVREYVNEVGRRIIDAAQDQRFDYHFYVVKEQEPNAFAIPGGHIFVTSGLIRFVDTEDELAGVIGHETGHSVLRHIDKAMDRAKRLSLVTLAAIIAGAFLSKDARGTAALTAGAMALAQSLMLKYSRENEFEADQKGIKYMAEAHYDPQAMIIFLKKIYRWERAISPDIPTYLATHPAIDERITYLSDTSMDMPKSLTPPPPAAGDLKKIQIRIFLEERGGTEGISRFSSLLQEKPGDVDALYGLGMSYAMVGKTKEAISYLSEALKASPKDGYIVRELGMAYFQTREVDKALDALQEALHTFPHDTSILYYLAQINQERGRWDDALSFYQRVLELDPGRTELYHDLGVVYDKKGVLDLSHENFGLYFKEKGQRETALFHFRKALEYTRDVSKRRHLEELIKECEGKEREDKMSHNSFSEPPMR